MNKIHNNLNIENLIKTEWFKQLNKDKKREILKNSDWFNQFNLYEQVEINWGLEENLDISVYAKPEFDFVQMRKIREELKNEQNIQ